MIEFYKFSFKILQETSLKTTQLTLRVATTGVFSPSAAWGLYKVPSHHTADESALGGYRIPKSMYKLWLYKVSSRHTVDDSALRGYDYQIFTRTLKQWSLHMKVPSRHTVDDLALGGYSYQFFTYILK